MNYVAAVYEDLSYTAVRWNELKDLRSPKKLLMLRVFHEQPPGHTPPNEVRFSGDDALFVTSFPFGMMVHQWWAPGGGGIPEQIKHTTFFNDGSQSIGNKIDKSLMPAVGGGSEARFFAYDGNDFDIKVALAEALTIDPPA